MRFIFVHLVDKLIAVAAAKISQKEQNDNKEFSEGVDNVTQHNDPDEDGESVKSI